MNSSHTKRGMGAIATIILILILIIGGVIIYKMYGSLGTSQEQKEEMLAKQHEAKAVARRDMIVVKAMLENKIETQEILNKISKVKVDLFNAYENASIESELEFESFMKSILEIEDAIQSGSENATLFIENFIAIIDDTRDDNHSNDSTMEDEEIKENMVMEDGTIEDDSGSTVEVNAEIDASVDASAQ